MAGQITISVSARQLTKRIYTGSEKKIITFAYDDFTKGKQIAIFVTNPGENIDVDNQIILEHNDLKKIIVFLNNE